MPSINFKGKTFVRNHHLAVKYHQLVPKKELSLTSNVALHDNLIIDGDNLKALKALLPTFAGKIKCIYIDPPYNTGNEGWIYNDNVNSPMIQEWLGKVVDKEDLTRHDKWLCMMLPRLKLLREFLTEDGAIFISIDDNEQQNLRMLMDEIFGVDNFIGMLGVVNNLKGRNDKKNIAQCHEYVLIYSKSQLAELTGLPLTEEQRAEFKYTDENGEKYALRDLRKRGRPDRREDRPNMFFSLFYNLEDKTLSLKRKSKTDIEIIPKRGDGTDGRWRWGIDRVLDNLKILRAKYSKKNDRWDIEHRVYLNQVSGGAIPGEDDLDEDEEQTERVSKSKSIWFGGELSTDVGRRELQNIIPNVEFDYPKSVGHLKRVLNIANCRDGYILDSFAGSGTTAQAVLELNNEDGGKRKFILVQCDETDKLGNLHKVADKITAERVRRVIKGVKAGKNKNLKKGTGGTFSYFNLGEPIEMESILRGRKMPTYLEFARYLFYTATGEEFDTKKVKEKQHFIGTSKNYEVYLFYKPDVDWLKSNALTLKDIQQLPKHKRKQRLVFAPSKYIDDRTLRDNFIDFCQLPYEIYRLQK